MPGSTVRIISGGHKDKTGYIYDKIIAGDKAGYFIVVTFDNEDYGYMVRGETACTLTMMCAYRPDMLEAV